MKLTEEECRLVEENHNLIYWYLAQKHLDIEEWYDLLAIELCYTIQKYDPSKGSLSNYFKLRCDGLISKEYRKMKSQKWACENVEYIENVHGSEDPSDIGAEFDVAEWLDSRHGEIIRMRYEGYTQTEIAKALGMSQSQVSQILKSIRKRHHDR